MERVTGLWMSLVFFQQPLLQSETGVVVLKIESAKKSDQGQYLCYGFPPDRSTYEAKAITVKVTSGDQGEDGRDEPSTSDRSKKAPVNSNTELECDLSRDNSELRWSKAYGVSQV